MEARYRTMKQAMLVVLFLALVCLSVGFVFDVNHASAVASGILIVVAGMVLWAMDRAVREQHHWYECILDAVPLPLSVTDMEMNWTFVNKVVEDLLQKKRHEIVGMACHNWGANICRTENCGVVCLRRNQKDTAFHQWSRDFTVSTHYLTDLSNSPIGHVEVVQDVTEKKSLNELIDKIADYATSILKSSESLAGAAGQISASSEETSVQAGSLATGMEQASQMIAGIAGAAEEVSSNLNGVAAAMEQTSRSIDSISANSRDGTRLASEAAESADRASAIMTELGTAATETGEVTELIKSIADQTNLLALNATIEAARAGEMGKGFAVVAGEVKNLANQSANSADDIVERITGMQQISEKAVSSIENVNGVITTVSNAVSEISDSITQQKLAADEVTANLAQASQGSNDSAENINQASTVIQKMALNVQHISEAARGNAETLKSVNDSTKDLSRIASELNDIIQRNGQAV